METHIERLSDAQRDLGIDVTNVFNVGDSAQSHIRVWQGWNLSSLRPAALRNALFYAGVLNKTWRLRGSGVVLHIHGDWSDFLFSKLLARALKARLVAATLHSGIQKKSRLMYRAALSHCDLVLATGRQERDWLAETLRREVHHVPSAPLDVFFADTREEESPIWDVICVAKFRKVKRVDILLECARLRPDVRFVLIGDGPQKRDLEDRIEELHLSNVTMLGKLSPEDVASHLRRARVFLLTSVEEGTPTAALEAMACGVPVALTPSNDYSWLIDQGAQGLLLRSWDPSHIVSELDGLLLDESRRRRMGQQARDRARRHSWKSNAEYISGLMGVSLKSGRN